MGAVANVLWGAGLYVTSSSVSYMADWNGGAAWKENGKCQYGIIFVHFAADHSFALVLSYSITTMKRLNAPRWLIVLTKFIAVISPYYTAYIGLITKDTLYSYAFLLFMIELIYLVYLLRGSFGINACIQSFCYYQEFL